MSATTHDTIEPRYLGVRGAARYSSLSVEMVNKLLRAGRLRKHKVGRKVLIERAELEGLIRGGAVGA